MSKINDLIIGILTKDIVLKIVKKYHSMPKPNLTVYKKPS